jgi:hypothetical protein
MLPTFRACLALLFALLAIAVASPGPAQAGVIFSYDSTCLGGCADIGLSAGAPVSARVEFTDSAIIPNATLSVADIIDFSLDFAAVHLDPASVFGVWFFGVLDATAAGFTEFQLSASDSFAAPGILVFLDVTGWAAGPGTCLSEDCVDFLIEDPAFGLGSTIARLVLDPGPIPVPEPSAALVLLAALGWLAWNARRQQVTAAAW